mgnify:CR=1 FL=1
MIEVVLCFAVLLMLFEFVMLSMIAPKYRLRLLGSKAGCQAVHMGMLLINMWVHWGTVSGTMAATGVCDQYCDHRNRQAGIRDHRR